MSQVLINRYLTELANLRRVGGTHRESVVREAFKDLLKSWGRTLDLTFIPEYELETRTKERRYVDGALLHTLRVPFGYWEAKDEKDDLDAEIELKLRRGYPRTNIVFEDSKEAVLIQHGEEVMRCGVEEVAQLEKLLRLFFGYERPEIEAFRKAVQQFKADLPAVLGALREIIERSHRDEPNFRLAAGAFLVHAQEAINPSLTAADVREMLIQHILTGEVFAAVFPDTAYHEDNSVARELHKLEATFFTGNAKHQTLKGLAPYYAAIRKAATEIATHHQKQTFLKAIYENFYKVYNPKAADRLGVVYTPNEIVRFMIESADWLCEQHFGRSLIDKDVDILDPATGTGTFICELIEHFAGQPEKLKRKYLEELHANEVAILPYYVANLNIEATYAAVTGGYAEFPGLCFVDTLDNTFALRKHAGHMDDLFGSVSDDNVKRIRQQNSRRISVIIGNPPYNANQLNENENNKNREYPEIDKRIKETYIAASTAQKTKLYDMYARFFRWAADRLDENGVLAFISNRSFIDSRTFDGFRACAAKEFNEIRIVDLGGDVRANPKLSGTTHNVFGIQTGVAISFMVRKRPPSPRERRAGGEGRCRIFYARRPEMETAGEKLAFLHSAKLREITVEEVRPDAKHTWLNLTTNDFDELLPLASKAVKAADKPTHEKALFKLFSLGVSTSRDEWVYGESEKGIMEKTSFLIDGYNADLDRAQQRKVALNASELTYDIKWTRAVKSDLAAGVRYKADQGVVIRSDYRPFDARLLHFNGRLIEVQYQQTKLFGEHGSEPNKVITFTDAGSQKPFMALACQHVFDYHFVGAAAAASGVSLYRYENGQRIDNITDWSLGQFRKHYRSLPQRGRAGEGEARKAGTEETAAPHLFHPAPLPENLRARARELRANLTDAEQVLWQCLRRDALGVRFRRQHPIDPYVLDFYCVEEKLAIEVDGGQHAEELARVHDAQRDAFLRNRGVRTLRFWNNEVLGNIEGVLETIVAELGRGEPPPRSSTAEGESPPQPSPAGIRPPPQPSPAGGGGMAPSLIRGREITKEAIFHYVYAVLHDPLYREKYALNLKREFPRIPFYPDFWQWADWGKRLMDLHIGYESVAPFPLARADVADEKARKAGLPPKALLNANKETGQIRLDSETTLSGVPPEAWNYRLGNRSALEWVLDQYKEKTPRDPTIRERFNTYRFADYKVKVIDLLARVTTVSVQTMGILGLMKHAPR